MTGKLLFALSEADWTRMTDNQRVMTNFAFPSIRRENGWQRKGELREKCTISIWEWGMRNMCENNSRLLGLVMKQPMVAIFVHEIAKMRSPKRDLYWMP